MAELIYDQCDRLVGWAESIIGVTFRPDAKAIGLGDSKNLKAVVVFDDFSECDCNMHLATNGTGHDLSRSLFVAAFSFPFIQLKLNRVTGMVPTKNLQAFNLNTKMGFRLEGIARKAIIDDDLYILGMLREECRFIPKKYRS